MLDTRTECLNLGRREVARRLGCTADEVSRYITRGTNGVRLDAVKIGRRWKTSAEAVQRFVDELQGEQREAVPTARINRQQHEEAMRRLRELGMRI